MGKIIPENPDYDINMEILEKEEEIEELESEIKELKLKINDLT